MQVTRKHIDFYDACKLRLAFKALLGSENRQKLLASYMQSPKVKRMVSSWAPKAEDITPEKKISIHTLIPECEREDSIRHRRARGRRAARRSFGAGHHLQRNLCGFVAGKVRREDRTFDEVLLEFAAESGGKQPYWKWARRWARKRGIVTPEMAQEWRALDDNTIAGRARTNRLQKTGRAA